MPGVSQGSQGSPVGQESGKDDQRGLAACCDRARCATARDERVVLLVEAEDAMQVENPIRLKEKEAEEILRTGLPKIASLQQMRPSERGQVLREEVEGRARRVQRVLPAREEIRRDLSSHVRSL